MPAWLLPLLANPTVVAAVVGAGAWIWHKVVTSSAAQSGTLAAAVASAKSAMGSIVSTLAPGSDPGALAAQLADVATKHLGAVGLDPSKSPLAAALVNAAVHELVAGFVDSHPPEARPALRAAVASVATQPAVRAAQ